MQARLSRRVGLQVLALFLGGFVLACASAGGGAAATSKWKDQTVYTRVGMHVEAARKAAGWHMYSTNQLALPKFIPAGSKLTVRSLGRNRMEVAGDDGSPIQLEYVARSHPDLTFDAWLDRQLSTAPIALPSGIDSKERDAIEQGRYEVGMSREALFLAIGYPPASLSPSTSDPVLVYEQRKFNRIEFRFDDQGRLSEIKD